MDQLQLHIPFSEEFYNICLDSGDNPLLTDIKDLHWENSLAEIVQFRVRYDRWIKELKTHFLQG